MRAAIYARVSTTDKGQDPENQLRQLREFARVQDWVPFNIGKPLIEGGSVGHPFNLMDGVDYEYIDYVSAKTGDRAQFKRLFENAAKRRFDIVLFWSLDRFSREGAAKTLQYLEQLQSYGVGFKSYTEQYLDSCGLFKEAVISILAVIAKQERVRLSERTRAGIERARGQGKKIGRPDRATVALAAIKRLRDQGLSWREVARSAGVSVRTARRAYGKSG